MSLVGGPTVTDCTLYALLQYVILLPELVLVVFCPSFPLHH
jgi:hypothetical protein